MPALEGVPTAVQSRGPDVDEASDASSHTYVLRVVGGPDKGLVFTIDDARPTTLVGQSTACDLRLTDREVSRRHLSLTMSDGKLRLRDLESTNGTQVDRVRVIECELRGEEVVRIGSTTVRIEHASTPPALAVEARAFGRVLGASDAMRRLYPLCERLAASNVPVILEGETGTGKEHLAEALHERGPRAAGPFVVFDCTAVSPSLVEAELFGHERGAFTGAIAARPGIFEQAHGGTLLIDEIGDLDLALQAKLLRAVERSEVRRVGGIQTIRVDVRLLSATRRDLDREVQEGRFRDDLFHRIAVTRIELPPLRLRRGDIPVLARHFAIELGGDDESLPASLLAAWDRDAWPGNVRELRNAVARHLALGELASLGDARNASAGPSDDPIERVLSLPFPRARDQLLEELEHRYFAAVLERHGGDVARASAASGIGRRYFNRIRSRVDREKG